MRLLCAIVAMLALAGCSSSGSSSDKRSTRSTSSVPAPVTSDTPTPTATVATSTSPPLQPKAVSYGAVTDLRDALIAAGYPCRRWRETDKVTNAAESGSCSAGDVLCVYASESSRDRQIAQTRANNDLLKSAHIPGSVVLFGPNWSVNFESKAEATTMRLSLGGVETK